MSMISFSTMGDLGVRSGSVGMLTASSLILNLDAMRDTPVLSGANDVLSGLEPDSWLNWTYKLSGLITAATLSICKAGHCLLWVYIGGIDSKVFLHEVFKIVDSSVKNWANLVWVFCNGPNVGKGFRMCYLTLLGEVIYLVNG
jgi:hypothetical protein